MARLFVGSFLSESGRASVQAIAKDSGHLNQSWNTKIRWVDQSKLHMTWIFLGDIEDAFIPDISAKLAKAVSDCRSETPLELNYDQFELWPNERKARLGVITPSVVPIQIFKIDKILKQELREFLPGGNKQHEKNDFQPHITVLRFPHRKKGANTERVTARVSDVEIASNVFPVYHLIDQIALIESDLGKATSGYEAISVFRL